MSEIDTDKLRALAEKASAGPWVCTHHEETDTYAVRAFDETDNSLSEPVASKILEYDASYIAAANPAVIIALLDRLERAEADKAAAVAAMRERCADLPSQFTKSPYCEGRFRSGGCVLARSSLCVCQEREEALNEAAAAIREMKP